MTSRRIRKLRRENSVMGLLRQAQADRALRESLDAARWRPDADGESLWNNIVWPEHYPNPSHWVEGQT